MPQTMKAAVYREYGGPEVLGIEDVSKPAPARGEILIKIMASTVATADCETRSFTFPGWLWLPLRLAFGVFRPRKYIQILGQELAGEVEAVGSGITTYTPGDKVVAAIQGFGAHAEYKCLSENSIIAPMPEGVSYQDAVTYTAFGLNALHFIRKAALQPGEKILINGAGSSIGTTAVQLAKRDGAEVTAVDGEGKLDMLRAIGADHVIDYARDDFTKNGVTYDVILDVIGKSSFSRSMKALSENGRYIFANPKALPMLRGFWSNRKKGGKRVLFQLAKESAEDLLAMQEMVEKGSLKAVIDRSFRLDEIVEAHRYVGSGEKKGHVILQLST